MVGRSQRMAMTARLLLIVAAATLLSGCASKPKQRSGEVRAEAQLGPEGLTVTQIQSELMSYADNFADFV